MAPAVEALESLGVIHSTQFDRLDNDAVLVDQQGVGLLSYHAKQTTVARDESFLPMRLAINLLRQPIAGIGGTLGMEVQVKVGHGQFMAGMKWTPQVVRITDPRNRSVPRTNQVALSGTDTLLSPAATKLIGQSRG